MERAAFPKAEGQSVVDGLHRLHKVSPNPKATQPSVTAMPNAISDLDVSPAT